MNDRISPQLTRHFLALCRVHHRDGRATCRTVAAESGFHWNTTMGAMHRLRDHGLVDFNPGGNGTLRPLYGPVPIGGQQ